MNLTRGTKLKSKLSGITYEVKMVTDKSVIIEEEEKDRTNQEWTANNLDIFFEELSRSSAQGGGEQSLITVDNG